MSSGTLNISAEVIEHQLERIRHSPLFSNSRRYPIFLEYVVLKTLHGHGDELKERTIGVEAFGRAPDYDLNADPVVRVTAGEVRKRLAQYYYEVAHPDELRIDLRPGTYVPEFRYVQAPEAAAPATSTRTLVEPNLRPDKTPALPVAAHLESQAATSDPSAARWKRISAWLLVALIAASAAAVRPLIHRSSYLDMFWGPVIDSNGPVFMSVASVVAMVNGTSVAPPPSTVSGHPLASDPIALSDAMALSSIQQVLLVRSKATVLQSSTGTSFSDLQRGPDVLISGFNNQWTMRLTDPLRFHFARTSTDDYTIQDRQGNRQWGINTAAPFVKMSKDYGIIARFHDPTTEQIVVVAAGIGENGTIAASRAISDEDQLAEMKQEKVFPTKDQNFEAVIETEIIDGKPGPPHIVASYVW